MSIYYYLSLVPEALIASMLPPPEFGTYLAIGTQKRTRGQAMYFSLDNIGDLPFDLSEAEKRCVPHPGGEPKHSVYLSIYRVLEQTPLGSLKYLHLVTPDGRVLELRGSRDAPSHSERFHLYQEICPVHPRVVSSLAPPAFARYITSREIRTHVPKICFVDLRLGELAENPETGSARDLPYYAIEHLRDCLAQLKGNPDKHTKIVDRTHPQFFPYRTIDTGFYVGDGRELLHFSFPSEEALQTAYYDWWRSASIMGDFFGLLP
jgi:hypothetical protein